MADLNIEVGKTYHFKHAGWGWSPPVKAVKKDGKLYFDREIKGKDLIAVDELIELEVSTFDNLPEDEQEKWTKLTDPKRDGDAESRAEEQPNAEHS